MKKSNLYRIIKFFFLKKNTKKYDLLKHQYDE